MAESVFEKIVKGELPAYKVWENENFMAFLSINPLVEGHTLVIPKDNWSDYLFDIEDQKYQQLMLVAKEVAGKVERGIDCERVLMWVEGFEVPHVHIHLLPGKQGHGLRHSDFVKLTPEEFQAIQQKIIEA